VVLEFQPYRRLSYSWHTVTPVWAEAVGVGEDTLATLRTERRSTVTFELEPHGEQVKLTVTHDDLEPGGVLLGMIRVGWPALLASLKTLLETGEPLPTPA
jgi:uncharacterized protein YndB with AHSA1/START domain